MKANFFYMWAKLFYLENFFINSVSFCYCRGNNKIMKNVINKGLNLKNWICLFWEIVSILLELFV